MRPRALVENQQTKGTFGGVYIPCIYSHARWSYRRRFSSLLLCPLSVERYYSPLFVETSVVLNIDWPTIRNLRMEISHILYVLRPFYVFALGPL